MITILALCFVLASLVWSYLFYIEVKNKFKKQVSEIEVSVRDKTIAECKELNEKQVSEYIETLKQKFSLENSNLISQALCSSKVSELQNEMSELLEKHFNRMTQEFIGQLIDDSDTLKAELLLNIGDKIWDRLQQVKENIKDTPYVLPQDCKLAYTKGNRTIVVLEQQPQVRSIVLSPELVSNKDVPTSQSQSASGYRFRLSFPYVLFFIVFDDGRYKYHELYFRNKPLFSTRERVYHAPIPNIFTDRGEIRTMCMGGDFNIDRNETLSKQSEFVVSTFWQSTFNDHLGDGNSGDIDKKIKNWRTWQSNTEIDPLFILKIQWKQSRTAKGIIESLLEKRDFQHKLDGIDREIKEMIDSGINDISSNIRKAVESAKEYKLKKKDISKFVSDSVKSILVTHTDEVFEKCTQYKDD